jgi:transcriptional regulator with XRE-family HTH domain
MQEMATKLRRIREIYGYSQEYVADRLGILDDLKKGELNTVLIKVHELQIEILRKKILG